MKGRIIALATPLLLAACMGAGQGPQALALVEKSHRAGPLGPGPP